MTIAVYLLIGIIIGFIDFKIITKHIDESDRIWYEKLLSKEKNEDTEFTIKHAKSIMTAGTIIIGIRVIVFWPRTIYEFNVKPYLN